MELNNVEIDDTYAEAFTYTYMRILITAVNEKWAKIAAVEACGYGTSMIGCSSEAGIEGFVDASSTPDGRPGYVIQIWASKKKMDREFFGRIGQCVLTSLTTAVYNYLESDEMLDLGSKMRFFGDGFESEDKVGATEVVSIPVMMGDFKIEKNFGIGKGVAGGNFIILAKSEESALDAAQKAVDAIKNVGGVIMPFPGGACASGSKIGSRYKFMHASTNELFCPTISDRVENSRMKGIGAAVEIVIDGVSEEKVKEAMNAGIGKAAEVNGVKKISAGNYGGDLGNVLIHLKDCIKFPP
jgi:formylmethanofuran--tetrahydromethanopterin N-formyltransferase